MERLRPSYRRALRFVALNDEPSETDVEVIKHLLSTLAIAEAFGVTPERVARDVVAMRSRESSGG